MARLATLEITSLAFMFVEVPDPVWKMSTTNASSCFPSMTSWAASTMARDNAGSSCPSPSLTTAADCLTWPIARMNARLNLRSLIGKFSSARRVLAPYRASAGTSSSPIESRSTRTAPVIGSPPVIPLAPSSLSKGHLSAAMISKTCRSRFGLAFPKGRRCARSRSDNSTPTPQFHSRKPHTVVPDSDPVPMVERGGGYARHLHRKARRIFLTSCRLDKAMAIPERAHCHCYENSQASPPRLTGESRYPWWG